MTAVTKIFFFQLLLLVLDKLRTENEVTQKDNKNFQLDSDPEPLSS